jgi:hypothetical protein
VNIISQFGCPQGAFVKVNLSDAGGNPVDTGIDEIASLPAGQIGLEHGDTFQPTAASVRVYEIDCFNY